MICIMLGIISIQLMVIAILLREIKDKMPPPPAVHSMSSYWPTQAEYDAELEKMLNDSVRR